MLVHRRPPFLLRCCLLCCLLGPKLGRAELDRAQPQPRLDAVASLNAVLCPASQGRRQKTSPTTEPPTEPGQALWQAGLYDAGIHVRFLHPQTQEASAPLASTLLLNLARAWAIESGQSGYAASVCKTGEGWMATLAAPAPLHMTAHHLAFPSQLSKKLCQQTRLSYAALKGGRSQTLKHTEGKSFLAELTPGFVSLSCLRRGQENAGPQLWYLAPVGLPASPLPHLGLVGATDATAMTETRDGQLLQSWINLKRQEAQLPRLDFSQTQLQEQATRLAFSQKLAHDRKLLHKVAEALLPAGIRALGEDRVAAKTLPQLAALLWHSPEHRDLLLSPQAELAALAYTSTPSGLFAVLLTGRWTTPRGGQAQHAGPGASSAAKWRVLR